jgi:hypothetical protein
MYRGLRIMHEEDIVIPNLMNNIPIRREEGVPCILFPPFQGAPQDIVSVQLKENECTMT